MLDRLFHPIHGGPDGTGWPPGRAVERAETMAALEAVPGVAGVTGLVFHAGEPPRPFCERVALCPHELVRVRPHRLGATHRPAPGKTRIDRDDRCR